jgi:hypothetical protein
VSRELKELPNQLGEVYENIVQKAASLDKPQQFYSNYVAYFFNRSDLESSCLSTLGYLIKKGNTTVYEWRTGVAPKHVEKAQEVAYNFGDETENQTNEAEDKIDFGDFDAALPSDQNV